MKVTVAIGFGQLVREGGVAQELEVEALPTDSVRQLKEKVAAAAGGAITADDLLLAFGPNDRKIGRQYARDPTVDESKLLLSQFSLLAWIERFPHWRLSGVGGRAAGRAASGHQRTLVPAHVPFIFPTSPSRACCSHE